MGTDYVTVQAKLKNALLAGQGTYDLGDPDGGELVLISEDQATYLRQWWTDQVLSAWEAYSKERGTLPETQQKELQAAQNMLAAIDVHETENGPWLAYEQAATFWHVTGRTAILLNAIGVVSSVEETTWDSIYEAVKEAPERIGDVIGDVSVAVAKTTGEVLYGLIKGVGFTALILAAVVAGTIIVLRRFE